MNAAKVIDLLCEPKQHQWDAMEATRYYRVVWLCGGLGGGKTWLLVWWCFLMATQWARGVSGLLFQPDFATFGDIFMREWRKCIPGEGTLWEQRYTRSGSHQIVIRVNKSTTTTIFVRSAMNKQTVQRSEGLTDIGWGALDEPARMLVGRKAFTNTVGRVRGKVPGFKTSPILMVGSPLGLHHWTAQAMGCVQDHPRYGYTEGYEPNPQEKPGYYIRACRTRDNAENLRDNYESDSRIAFGEALAAQEFNASLMSTQGQVIPEFDSRRNVLPHEMMREMWLRRVKRPVGAGDWGEQAAATLGGWTGNREFLTVDGCYPVRKTALQLGVRMHRIQQHYMKQKPGMGLDWYCDPSEPGNIRMLKSFEYGREKYRLNTRKAKNAWLPGIDFLRNLMMLRRDVDHPAYPAGNGLGAPRYFCSDKLTWLIKEFNRYRYKAEVEGRPKSTDTDPMCADHGVDTVRYGAFTTGYRGERAKPTGRIVE